MAEKKKEYDEMAESEGRNGMEINAFFKMMAAKGAKIGEALDAQPPFGSIEPNKRKKHR